MYSRIKTKGNKYLIKIIKLFYNYFKKKYYNDS